jgi:hypothetical protein
MKRAPYYAKYPDAFRRFDYSGGGFLWIHNSTGAAVGGRVVCDDGRARAVRFLGGGFQCFAGAWDASIRIGGRTHKGRAWVSEVDPDRPRFRFVPFK